MFHKHSSLKEFPETHPREELPNLAIEALEISNNGFYTNRKNENVSISDAVKSCISNTKAYPPTYLFTLPTASREGKIEMSLETTLGAMHRIVVIEGVKETCALNFANPLVPGGSFRGHARAQEESLCRASCLYDSIVSKQEMYQYNHSKGKASSDYMIFSPYVTFFRDDQKELLDSPFQSSIITAAAVIAPKQKKLNYSREVNDVMEIRIRKIVECAAENGVRVLILGAFGCGAFHCDTKETAKLFRKILVNEKYRFFFDKVVFAIFEVVPKNTTIEDFKTVFNITEYAQ